MWFQTQHGEFSVAFTDAREGNLAAHTGQELAAVTERRRALARWMGLAPDAVRYLRQVHGTDVVRLDGPHDRERADADPSAAPQADAAVTASGVPLAVLTADCLPVVFVATGAPGEPGLSAVAHAGRRGLLDGVLATTVAALESAGALEITAWIGPAICGACYEVPAQLQRDSERVLPGIGSTTSWGTPGLDLPGAAERWLSARGVRVATAGLDRHAWCTLEHPELPSYRRDATPLRLAGLVWPTVTGAPWSAE